MSDKNNKSDNVEFGEGQWTPSFGKLNKEEKEVSEYEMARLGAEITLARVDNFEDLNAETKEKGHEKFKQKTKELWKEFVVHGMLGKDKEGKRVLTNFSDLDGDVSIGFLKLAGIDTSSIKYVHQGDFVEGKINIDTGNRWGLVVKDGGKTVFIDHHGPDAKKGTSSAEITYKLLTGLGLLDEKKYPYLGKIAEFVTKADNADYDLTKGFFEEKFSRTLFGLRNNLSFEHLQSFFGNKNNNQWDVLDDRILEKMGKDKLGKKTISEHSKELQKKVEYSNRVLKLLEKKGKIIDSKRYGKIVIDEDGKIPCGFDAVKAFGCGAYVKWVPKNNFFFISAVNKITDDFSQGINVRGNMWIKENLDNSPLEITLDDIVKKMTGDVSFGRLQKFMEESSMKGMEQPKVNTKEIKQKTPESQEAKKEISVEEMDKALDVEEGILDGLNKYVKEDTLKDIDFKNNLKFRGVDVDEKFDEITYGKATLEQKILNFAILGLAKKDLGLLKSKERGLLNKDIFNKEIEGKEFEVGQNQEERSDMEKTIGNMRKEFGAEDLGKRHITKRFEVVDGKVIKIVQASRTEQGMLDAAGKLLNEKIEGLEKGAGVDVIKEKEGLEKHYSSKEKIVEMTKYLGSEAKEEINKKINQEEVDTQERIKEKEENLKSELDVFRIPFQERLDKTSELVDNFSGMLKDTKEAENKYNGQLKNINLNIQQAQKSGLLEESKKELVKELESKKMEFEEKAKEFGLRKNIFEAKLGQLKINKAELEKTVNKINGIGKTKKEITEEKAAKERNAPKTEKDIPEPAEKEEKKETAGKRNEMEFAEEKTEEIKDKHMVVEDVLKTAEKTFTDKEIEKIVTTQLKILGLSKIKDKKIQDQITKNAIINVKKMIEKTETPMTDIYIEKETKRVFDALSSGYFKRNK